MGFVCQAGCFLAQPFHKLPRQNSLKLEGPSAAPVRMHQLCAWLAGKAAGQAWRRASPSHHSRPLFRLPICPITITTMSITPQTNVFKEESTRMILNALDTSCSTITDSSPPTAVSYTHLDVYKRQAQGLSHFIHTNDRVADRRQGNGFNPIPQAGFGL